MNGIDELELEYQLRDSGAKLLLAGPSQISVALDAAARVGLPRDKVYLFCDPDDATNYSSQSQSQSLSLPVWTQFWRPAAEVQSWSWRKMHTVDEAKDTTAIINYSSGTTGLPKGTEISHYNAVANSTQLLAVRATVSNDKKGRERKERLDMSGERWLAPLPMYHAYVPSTRLPFLWLHEF